MQETIQFPIKKYESSHNIYSAYLQEYKIEILIRYQIKEKNQEKQKENKRDETNSDLESLLKQITEKFKEKIENKETQEKERYKIINPVDSKIISLEEKLKANRKYILPNSYKNTNQNEKLYNYLTYIASQSTNHHINQKSGAHVFYVPSSYLPQNVLGMYVPDLHTIYIANDLSEKEKEFVYFHEEYHSIHGAGEQEADNYAFQRTGYNLRAAA